MADELMERLQRREHHFRNAVEGEYDAELLKKARHHIERLDEALTWAEGHDPWLVEQIRNRAALQEDNPK